MLKSTHKLAIATGAALLLVGASSHAAITPFTQDFEAMTVADGVNGLTDLADDGWEVSANVFDGVGDYPGNYLYFYGQWSPAPNTGGGAFSAVANDDVSANGSGTKYLNAYNDYDNRGAQEAGQIVNGFVIKQYTIDASEIGKTLTFSFDAKRPAFEDDGLGGDASYAAGNNCSVTCIANAFIKTLDPSNNFNTTNYPLEVMTAISQSDWTRFTITLELTDPLLAGQLLQVGFETFGTNDDPTGVLFDNIELALSDSGPEPTSTNVPIPTIALLGFGALLAWSGMSSIRKRLS
tara:strand:- start:176 stop:1054 length:879 start_codon:yes stop_codon:yes gene_type:complete